MDDRAHILIVDDEPDIRQVLQLLLQSGGYVVSSADNGRAAIDYVSSHPDIDLILLDIMMPVLSGIDACRELRNLTNAPILFLTAKSADNDQMEAYERGGDDFLTKPFSQAVLMNKVSALLRRYKQYKGKPEPGLHAAALTIDPLRRCVSREGVALALTDKEYSILEHLLHRRGCVVSACELYENVWKEKYLPASANTVMVHILNLRKKVELDASNPKIIRTVWGKGYQID